MTGGITLTYYLLRSEIALLDIAALSLVTAVATGATICSMYLKRSYKNISQFIEKYGFAREIFYYKETRRLAEIYAKENDRTDEFRCALKLYQISLN